jgi:hypothetical protein
MTQHVRNRRVFYLSGFDPRGASHYHRVFRTEGRRQSVVNGLALEVSARRRLAPAVQGWVVDATDAASRSTRTAYEFLGWDDIIRRHWATTLAEVLADWWLTVRVFVFGGQFARFAQALGRQLVTGLYPVGFVLIALVLAAAAASAAVLAAWAIPGWPAWVRALAGAGLAGLAVWATAWLAMRLGNRLAVLWLLRIYAFSARWSRGETPGLGERSEAFAARIAAAAREPDVDEVLVVAHSVGTMLAVPVMAQVLAALDRAAVPAERLGLVTLGECIPLISFQPQAGAYRAALQTLGRRPDLLWVDYTAPTDGACFPLVDPVAASGLAVAPGTGPRVLSPRFFSLYAPERYRRLRRDWYGMHFLYLMATDYAYGYDYFAMTCGPQRLVARLAEVA